MKRVLRWWRSWFLAKRRWRKPEVFDGAPLAAVEVNVLWRVHLTLQPFGATWNSDGVVTFPAEGA